jgi:DNA-binding MarR family transcriptional regulator
VVSRSPLPFDPIAEAHRRWVEHGWADAADGMAAVTSIVRAQQILLGRIDEQLRPLELTFARYELLMLLHFSREGRLPLNVIGTRLQVHPTSVTSAVDRLERQGFVRRSPHPTDGRTTLAELTDHGRERALEATARLNATVFAAPGLAAHEVERLVAVLRVLRSTAGDF